VESIYGNLRKWLIFPNKLNSATGRNWNPGSIQKIVQRTKGWPKMVSEKYPIRKALEWKWGAEVKFGAIVLRKASRPFSNCFLKISCQSGSMAAHHVPTPLSPINNSKLALWKNPSGISSGKIVRIIYIEVIWFSQRLKHHNWFRWGHGKVHPNEFHFH